MSLRTDILPIADELRGLAGPSELDVRPSQLTIRKRTWSGGRIGLGATQDPVTHLPAAYTDDDAVVPQIYRIRHVSAREVASSGGRYEAEDIKVGPITPAYGFQSTAGGWSPSALKPDGTDAMEVIYVIGGADENAMHGDYTLIQLHTEQPFSFYTILRRRRTTP